MYDNYIESIPVVNESESVVDVSARAGRPASEGRVVEGPRVR
jgi:hypothetical protein